MGGRDGWVFGCLSIGQRSQSRSRHGPLRGYLTDMWTFSLIKDERRVCAPLMIMTATPSCSPSKVSLSLPANIGILDRVLASLND